MHRGASLSELYGVFACVAQAINIIKYPFNALLPKVLIIVNVYTGNEIII